MRSTSDLRAKWALVRGVLALTAGSGDRANHFFKRAAALAPTTSVAAIANTQISDLFVRKGKLAAARRQLAGIGDDPAGLRRVLALAVATNDLEAESIALSTLIALAPPDEQQLRTRHADILLARGDVGGGLENWRVLRDDGVAGNGYSLRLATALQRAGEVDAADEILASVVEARAYDHVRRGGAGGRAGRRRAVGAEAASATADEAESWKELADLARQTGDIGRELAALEQLLAILPCQLRERRRAANLSNAAGDTLATRAHLQKLAECQPGEREPWHKLADFLRRTGEVDGELAVRERLSDSLAVQVARTHVGSTIEHPNVVDDFGAQSGTLAGMEQGSIARTLIQPIDSSEVVNLRRLARLVAAQGDVQRELHLLCFVAYALRDDASAWGEAADCAAKVGDNAAEIWALRSLVDVAPSQIEAHRRLAELLEARGCSREAAREYRRIVELQPARDEPWNQIVDVAIATVDTSVQLKTLSAMAVEKPLKKRSRRQLLQLLRQSALDERRDQLPRLSVIAEMMADDVGAWRELVELARSLDAQEEHIHALSRVCALVPADVDARRALGAAFLQAGRSAEALQELLGAESLSPANEAILRLIANTYRLRADPGGEWQTLAKLVRYGFGAIVEIQRIADLCEAAGQGPEAYDWLSRLAAEHTSRGAHTDALAASKRALAIEPSSPMALIRVGDCCERLGDVSEAISYWSRAEALGIDSGLSAKLRKKINYAEMAPLTARGFPETRYHTVPDLFGRSAHKLMDIRANSQFYELAKNARDDGRTLLYFDRLFTIYQSIESLRSTVRDDVGVYLAEVGVYKGGGSRFIAEVAQALLGPRFTQFAVDTFEGHNSSDLSAGQEGGHITGMFNDTGFDAVSHYLSKFPQVEVLKGMIQERLGDVIDGDRRFSFVHLDTDLYEPTHFSLNHFGEIMVDGGIIVVDDYGFVTCPGVRRAVSEYLSTTRHRLTPIELMTGQLVIVYRD